MVLRGWVIQLDRTFGSFLKNRAISTLSHDGDAPSFVPSGMVTAYQQGVLIQH